MENHSASRKSAAGHVDGSVDPKQRPWPVEGDPASAGDGGASAEGPVDIRACDPRRAAARKVDDPDLTAGIEAARSAPDRIADARRDRSDRRPCSGRKRNGDAVEHLGVER